MKNDMKSVVVPVEVIDRLKALAEEGMYSNEMLMSLPPKNAVAYRLMEIVTPLLAAAPAPSSLAGGGSGLRAHFKAMQAMATAYLVPEDYRDRDGKITLHGDHNNTDQWKQPFRRFAETGRGATVTGRQGKDGPWIIRFDVLRGSNRPHTISVREGCFERDIEVLGHD